MADFDICNFIQLLILYLFCLIVGISTTIPKCRNSNLVIIHKIYQFAQIIDEHATIHLLTPFKQRIHLGREWIGLDVLLRIMYPLDKLVTIFFSKLLVNIFGHLTH